MGALCTMRNMVVFYVCWLTAKLHQLFNILVSPSPFEFKGTKSKAAKSLDVGKAKQPPEVTKPKQNASAAKSAVQKPVPGAKAKKSATPPLTEVKSQAKAKPEVPAEKKLEAAKKLDPADEIDWREEPFLTIVTNLAATHRVNK